MGLVTYNTQRQTDKERLFMYLLISIIIIQSLLIAFLVYKGIRQVNKAKYWKNEFSKHYARERSK
jgi:hypothetical protein